MSLIATCILCQARLPFESSNSWILILTQWKPARFRVKCGECGGRFYPTIRNAASRISNGLGAACILSCWPFCFLPALFTTASKYHLHCSNCNAYLGLYDVERDCLKEGKA
uniref:LITAF domain-containing protein n=1 Tax=Anopheles merus TaxID=30066 RepID=A0A182V418_ANOME